MVLIATSNKLSDLSPLVPIVLERLRQVEPSAVVRIWE